MKNLYALYLLLLSIAVSAQEVVYFKGNGLDRSHRPNVMPSYTSSKKTQKTPKPRPLPCEQCTTLGDVCEEVSFSNPCQMLFDRQGKLLAPLPTLLMLSQKIEVGIVEPKLSLPTPLYTKIQNTTWNKNDIIFLNASTYQSELINQKAAYLKKLSDDNSTRYSLYPSAPLLFDKSGKATLQLYQTNVDNMLLKQVFRDVAQKTPYKGWNQYKKLFAEWKKIFDTYAAKIDIAETKKELWLQGKANCPPTLTSAQYKEALQDTICFYLDSVATVHGQLHALVKQVIKDNEVWMQSWLWYSGGKPLLNPFGRVSLTDLELQIAQDLAEAEEMLRLHRSLSEQCCTSTDMATLLDLLRQPMGQLSRQVVLLQKTKEQAPKRQQDYQKWLKSIAETKTLLNTVELWVSDCNRVQWLNHFDASSDYANMNPPDLLPDYVYEKDYMRGLVHNLTTDQKASAQETVKAAPLRTNLDESTDDATDALAEAMKNSANLVTLLNRVRVLLEGAEIFFLTKSVQEGGSRTPAGGSEGENKRETPAQKAAREKAKKKQQIIQCCDERIKLFNETRQLVAWLAAQTEPPIEDLQKAYAEFDKTESEGKLPPRYRSQNILLNESLTAKGTNQINYAIYETGKDKPVAKAGYKTYNTVKWWPLLSINYVFGQRAVSIFDNATGQFQTNTGTSNFEAVVGVKWYIKESNMTRSGKRNQLLRKVWAGNYATYSKARGNGFVSKYYLLAGLSVSQRFFKNYFLGAGIDIVPGFSVQGGANLFFRKAYVLNNGQIEREYETPAIRGFVGVAIDQNVVTKLLKIF